ncbi:hypothetical protein F5Y09DRAFT_344043 [Xylaria sp. FL1042]|nr:hypothetical protein F5Y09DRAFT_344043 [Xylaria sp. FL1042]
MAKTQPSEILTIPLAQFGPQGIDEEGARDEIAAQVFDFIECSETCVLRHKNASTALPHTDEASIELRPVFLPPEITLDIIQYLNQPYQLQGISSDVFPGIVFSKPRQWADIPAFQICHTTRARAIKRYGKPEPNSLPFDASVDSLSFGSYHVRPNYSAIHPRSEPGPALLDSSIKHLEEVLRSKFPKPRYCYIYDEIYEESERITNPGKLLCDDFLDKIQYVKVEADGALYDPFFRWEREWIRVSRYFGRLNNIRKLKINIPQLDACCPPGPNLDPNYITEPFHGCSEVAILRAFLNNPDLIKSLEVLEIEKTWPKCSKNLTALMWVKSMSFGEILFGPEPLASWAPDRLSATEDLNMWWW